MTSTTTTARLLRRLAATATAAGLVFGLSRLR